MKILITAHEEASFGFRKHGCLRSRPAFELRRKRRFFVLRGFETFVALGLPYHIQ